MELSVTIYFKVIIHVHQDIVYGHCLQPIIIHAQYIVHGHYPYCGHTKIVLTYYIDIIHSDLGM